MAAAIVNEMRARIHSATALTASAGIACTRRLAKICSGVFVSVSVCVNISLDLSRPLSTSLDLSTSLSTSIAAPVHPGPTAQTSVGLVNVALKTRSDNGADKQRVGLVAHLEHVLCIDHPKAGIG